MIRRAAVERDQFHSGGGLLLLVALLLGFPDAVEHVEAVQILWRDRHGSKNPLLALLQGPEGNGAGREIDALRGEFEGFGDPAAGEKQGFAEGSNLSIGGKCCLMEGLPLFFCEIEAVSSGVAKYL